jgi:hypothetical protein
MNIGFFVRHFGERGTEVSVYDYANYNEEILNNKSYIICFTQETQKMIGFPTVRHSYAKFASRFQILEINNFSEMKDIIDKLNLSFFYTQTHGWKNDIYYFHIKNIWSKTKTIKHCIFDTANPEGDYCISISSHLNTVHSTNIPVIPYIVHLPSLNEDLRNELSIPTDALVFGRHGGICQFDIPIVHEAIKDFLNLNTNAYFLFMNTSKFYEHPRIIYLPVNVDIEYKTKFINTCDAMIHARKMGETFGAAVAEFSVRNKPIITCNSGDIEHLLILGDKAVLYNSKEQLIDIFKNIRTIIQSKNDWNAYREYTPEKVMNKFKNLIFDKH